MSTLRCCKFMQLAIFLQIYTCTFYDDACLEASI